MRFPMKIGLRAFCQALALLVNTELTRSMEWMQMVSGLGLIIIAAQILSRILPMPLGNFILRTPVEIDSGLAGNRIAQ